MVKQTTRTNQHFGAQNTQKTGIPLAEMFADKTLADSSVPAIPAIEIVHYDQDNKRCSCDVLPLSTFAIQ
tara:strand:+ start:229 stop:438 length:210 start_codon:yes stop_codon:yes gene_type:complete